jgi:hypothetical protein
MCAKQRRGRWSAFDEAGDAQHGVAQVAELARARPQQRARRLPPPPRHQHVRRHHRRGAPVAVAVPVLVAPAPGRARGPLDVHRPRARTRRRRRPLAPRDAASRSRSRSRSRRSGPRRHRHGRRRAAAGRRVVVAVSLVVGRLRPQHLALAQLLRARHCGRWTRSRSARGSGLLCCLEESGSGRWNGQRGSRAVRTGARGGASIYIGAAVFAPGCAKLRAHGSRVVCVSPVGDSSSSSILCAITYATVVQY